jgi:hypothetical protein
MLARKRSLPLTATTGTTVTLVTVLSCCSRYPLTPVVSSFAPPFTPLVRCHFKNRRERRSNLRMVIESNPLGKKKSITTDNQSTPTAPSFPQSSIFLDEGNEITEECPIDYLSQDGNTCLLPDDDSPIRLLPSPAAVDTWLKYFPVVAPTFAFCTYEKTAKLSNVLINALSDQSWVAVDGGQYQLQIITPAVNGIVVPAIALLFATLCSNTINTLRQRQLDIRTTLNMEAGELRILQSMVDSFPPEIAKEKNLREYLISYVSRLIAESGLGVNMAELEYSQTDSEMNGFMVRLNEINVQFHRDEECGASNSIPPSIMAECYGAVTRLHAERSSRISALESTFPMLHYFILLALAASICVAFLMESNQDVQIFLSAVQLKILWSMLIGTFAALASVSYDLSDPFRGSYQISRSVDQFYTIRDTLRASSKLEVQSTDQEEYDPSPSVSNFGVGWKNSERSSLEGEDLY